MVTTMENTPAEGREWAALPIRTLATMVACLKCELCKRSVRKSYQRAVYSNCTRGMHLQCTGSERNACALVRMWSTQSCHRTKNRTKHLHSLPTSITIGNAQIPFKKSVKNLGFTLACHLTMNAHVSNIARTCYFELRRLTSIRRFLTSTVAATLVSAFVVSRIDYCNSLLFGSTRDVTSHLQRIQNYAARVILCLPKSSSITIHLKLFHWLPVKVRSTYKIACLCYHCHSSTAPSYVTDMQHRKPLHTRNSRSSSYTMPLLNRPAHSKATLGDRSFSFASSSVRNSIPNDVWCAPSLSSFKSRLKTYLFRSVYKD